METGLGSATARHASIAGRSGESSQENARLVLIRPQVIDNVGHVLGNLFQRLYHLTERTAETDPARAADLENSVRRLEDFLQLFIDYVSPPVLSLQYVSGTHIVQSLARQVGDAVGGAVKVDMPAALDERVLVDPGRLARAFALLAAQFRLHTAGEGIELTGALRASDPALVLSLLGSPRVLPPASAEAEMEWSVAERLLEMHGGTLRCQSTQRGEVLWEIVLPLQA